jgi:hypothetical protein
MRKLKVKSVKSLGEQQVYDLVMPTNHNFVLENGTVAHNCSYSIVSYNTAYLKNKYPVDFWLAELSAESGNEDKLREYAGELGDMILPVNILKSHPSEFLIEGEDKLRPPLLTLKGVGTKFAENVRKFLDCDLDSLCTRKPEKVKKEKAPKTEKPVKEPKAKPVKRSELLEAKTTF